MNALPIGWATARIPDLADILDSRRVPVNRTERAKRPGSVPYYGATGQVGWIDKPLFDEELCLLGEDGAPFLERDKPKAYLIDGPAWVNNHAHVLRAVAPLTSNRFLKYALDWSDYDPFVNGTTRLKLTKGALSRMEVPVPPLNEQRRIVVAIEEQFSRLDAGDELLLNTEARLDTLRRVTVTKAVAGYPPTPLGDMVNSVRYGTSVKCLADAQGPPVLRIPNIRDRKVDLTDLKFATVESGELHDCFVEEGDLLFVRTNGSRDLIGRVGVVGGSDRPAFASYLIRARPDPSRLDSRWAALALSAPPLRAVIESRAATTAGQYNLNLASLRSLEVPLPPLADQRRLVADIERVESVIEAMSEAIERARRRSASLRRAILEGAFRGELVPQDPSEEPAAALLERIGGERPQVRHRRVRT